MPEKWGDMREKQLLLEVIAASNPTVLGSAWPTIAAAMGGGYTAEACRQKFQGIKRNLKPTNADTTPKNTPTKATKTTKPKPPTSANASKGRKRKAAEANIHEDDEESTLFTPKSQRSKKENDAGTDGMGAEVFKAEDGENVDLERNDLYDNDDAA
ncbi:MAG: hypothetical protein Q9175_000844 [Cornicularia normoerica]